MAEEAHGTSTPEQADVHDQREHINLEKGRGISTARDVSEQVDQLAEGPDGQRLRDPLGGAGRQRAHDANEEE